MPFPPIGRAAWIFYSVNPEVAWPKSSDD